MIVELSIPPSTTELAPTTKTLDLFNNSVRGIIVNVPDGHKYLARLRIETQGRRLIPDFNSDPWVRGNNNKIVFNLGVTLEGPPYKLTLIGWNEDDTYPHTFYIEVQ